MTRGLVYVLDDDQEIRDQLVSLLNSYEFIALSCASADEFLARCRERSPSCAVIDARMPGVSGIELLSIMKARQMNVRVVMVTGHVDFDMAVQAMKLGAVDVLLRPFARETVLRAVESACAMNLAPSGHMAQSSAQAAAENVADDVRHRLTSLSTREREILDFIVRGKSSREIAADLGISVSTVNNHRTQIKAKMGTRTVAHLLVLLNPARTVA